METATDPPPCAASPTRQLAYSVGVLTCFSVSSLSQESLTRKATPGRAGFNHERFLVFAQSVAAALAAGVALLVERRTKRRVTKRVEDDDDSINNHPASYFGGLFEWGVVIGAYYASHYFGLASLRHLSYPIHVTFKSCKAVPVAIGERILTTRRHSAAKTLGVFVMCVGAAVFLLAGDATRRKKTASSPDTTPLGVFFVALALLFDGVYAGSQVTLVARCPSEFLLMLYMNAAQAALALASCVLSDSSRTNEFALAFDALAGHRSRAAADARRLRRDLLAFALSKALGTLCVYRLLRDSGTLVVATVTTLRKVLSVALSVLAFGHALSPLQCCGLLLVFLHKYVGTFVATRVVPRWWVYNGARARRPSTTTTNGGTTKKATKSL